MLAGAGAVLLGTWMTILLLSMMLFAPLYPSKVSVTLRAEDLLLENLIVWAVVVAKML
jgi:hypothetical protein